MIWPKSESELAPNFIISPRGDSGRSDCPNIIAFAIHGLDEECKPSISKIYKPPFNCYSQLYGYRANEAVRHITRGLGLRAAALELLAKILHGDKDASIHLFACDLGGLIVKEALLIARSHSDATHRGVFERTSLIAFYGTPHRSTDAQSWETIALSLLNRCYHGLLGPWTTDFVANFRLQQEKLAAEFLPLASQFHVINYFQEPQSLSDMDGSHLTPAVVVHKSCASFGIESEVCVGLDQSHRSLPACLRLRDREYVEMAIQDASIDRWQEFKNMKALFRLRDVEVFATPDTPFNYRHILSRFETLPRVVAWLNGPAFGSLHVQTGPALSPAKLFRGVRDSLQLNAQGPRQVAFICLDSNLHRCERLTEAQVVAGMCGQLLEQLPRLFLCIRDSMPNLEDAAISSDNCWKTRAFWKCLETLLMYPKDVDMYCLVDCDSSPCSEHILERLHLLMSQTEARFKLMSAGNQASSPLLSLESNQAVVDLTTSETTESLRSDLGEWADTLLAGNESPSSSSRTALLCRLCSAETFQQVDDIAGFFAEDICRPTTYSINVVWRTLTDESCLDSLMASQIQAHGRWLLVPIAWVAHAFRPIQCGEMDAALVLEELRDGGGCGRFQDFARLLPGVMRTRQGTLLVAGKVLLCFQRLWEKHFPEFPNPNGFLAETCVVFMSQFVEGWPTPQNQSILAEVSATAQKSLSAYAAKYWASHYQDATSKMGESCVIERFLDDPAQIQAWLSLLRRLRGCSTAGEADHGATYSLLSPQRLQKCLGISRVLSIEVSRRLIDMEPLSETGVAKALLIMGAETSNTAMILNSYYSILRPDSPTYDRLAICRAFAATTNAEARDMMLDGNDEFLAKNYDRVLLTSIALHNTSATAYLLETRIGALQPRTDGASWWTASSEFDLPTPLQVASQYGDRHIITRLLLPGEPWWALEETLAGPGSWNAIHYATANGYGEVVSEFTGQLATSDSDSRDRLVNSKSPGGNTPLLLTASRGLHGAAKQLLSLPAREGVDVERELGSGNTIVDCRATNEDGYTALLAAARHGFCELVLVFLAGAGPADLNACTTSRNNALHLSLHHGHERVANAVLGKMASCKLEELAGRAAILHPDADDQSPSASTSESDSEDDWDGKRSPQVPCYLVTNGQGETPFILATKRNLPSVINRLWEIGGGDLFTADLKANTPLRIAVQERSILLDYLLEKGKQVPFRGTLRQVVLGEACRRGYVEFLRRLGGTDLGLGDEEYSGRALLISAIRHGQAHIVPLLLPHVEEYTVEGISGWKKEAMQEALRMASMYGDGDVIDILLDRGIDINAQDSYGNTALQLASYYEKPRCVEKLLLRKAGVDISDGDGITAMADAARSGSSECLKLLIEACAPESLEKITSGGNTPLCMAIANKEAACVRLLLQRGAELKLCPYQTSHKSLLDFAVDSSAPEVLRILLDFFAVRSKHDEATQRGYVKEIALALKKAVLTSVPSMLEVLLDFYNHKAVDIGNGWSVVHLAAAHGNASILETVLEHEKVQPLVDDGTSSRLFGPPLQVAACSSKDSAKKVQCLLKKGAKAAAVYSRSRFGTALGGACYWKRRDVVAVLLKELTEDEVNYAYPDLKLDTAVRCLCSSPNTTSGDDDLEILRLLRKHGAVASLEGIDGTALHHAARRSPQAMVEELLSWPDASKTKRDAQGRFPFHLAAAGDDWGCLRLLTTPELSVAKKDKVGRNALHFAAGACSLDVVRGILDDETHLPMIATPDKDGWTPLHWAARKCDRRVVEYLVEKAAKYFGSRWDADQKKLRTTDGRNWTPLQVALFHGVEETCRRQLDQIWGSTKGTCDKDDISSDPILDFSRFYCDSCFVNLAREQYHCVDEDCFDFSLCFKCFRHSYKVHPTSHRFEKAADNNGFINYSEWRF